MRSIFGYTLTKREKFLLAALVVCMLGVVWYLGIYRPIQQRIEAADTTELEDEMAMEQIKASKIQSMQQEIAANKEAGLPEVPTYNMFKEEVAELNRVFANALDFSFQFTEPEADGTTVRRNIAVSFEAQNFDTAKEMLNEILTGPYRTMIHDVSIASDSRVNADDVENIEVDVVTVSFLMTAYETSYDADTTEGLNIPQETQGGGGLANSDMSNLQRSDLETAAEAVLEN